MHVGMEGQSDEEIVLHRSCCLETPRQQRLPDVRVSAAVPVTVAY